MPDCECDYPVLDCPCCNKEKAVVEGLIKRTSGYECYLRTFAVPASCQNLPWSAQLGKIGPGGNAKYNLADYVVGGKLSFVKVWPTVGCRCDFSIVSQQLYKLDNDCWGAIPVQAGTGVVPIVQYLSGKYHSKTMGSDGPVIPTVSNLLREENAQDKVRFGTVKAALEYLTEVRRHYNSILTALPC